MGHGGHRGPPHWQGAGFGPAERSSVPVSPQPPIATRHEPGCYAKNLPLFLGLGCIFQPEDANVTALASIADEVEHLRHFFGLSSSLDISGRNSLVRGLQLRGLCFLASNQVKPFKRSLTVPATCGSSGPSTFFSMRTFRHHATVPCNASANSLSAIASPCWAATRPSAVMSRDSVRRSLCGVAFGQRKAPC